MIESGCLSVDRRRDRPPLACGQLDVRIGEAAGGRANRGERGAQVVRDRVDQRRLAARRCGLAISSVGGLSEQAIAPNRLHRAGPPRRRAAASPRGAVGSCIDRSLRPERADRLITGARARSGTRCGVLRSHGSPGRVGGWMRVHVASPSARSRCRTRYVLAGFGAADSGFESAATRSEAIVRPIPTQTRLICASSASRWVTLRIASARRSDRTSSRLMPKSARASRSRRTIRARGRAGVPRGGRSRRRQTGGGTASAAPRHGTQ